MLSEVKERVMRDYKSNISAIIKSQGRTNAWFIRKMAVSEALFYAVEGGRRRATAGYRRRASQVLDLPESVLFLPSLLSSESESHSVENIRRTAVPG